MTKMITFRDEALRHDLSAEGLEDIVRELCSEEIGWNSASTRLREIREELSLYDIYQLDTGEQPKPDDLDQVLSLLRFLGNDLELKDRSSGLQHARSALRVITAA